ncbi:MAG: hypothetical protein WDZ69_02330 [Candidatus Pacearchaeota archaeon]
MDKIEPINGKYHKKRDWRKISVVTVFVLVLGFLVYTSFFSGTLGGISLTGQIISSGEPDPENSMKVDIRLNLPDNPSFKGEFSKIELRVLNDSVISSGDSLFEISSGDSIFLEDYDGEISFNENRIHILEGDARKVIINGASISSREGKSQISSKEISYGILNISEIHIKKLDYEATGLINIENGKNVILPRDERVLIGNFKGNLFSSRGDFKLNGIVERIEVSGDSEVSISKSDIE